jgi:glycosyltransferase
MPIAEFHDKRRNVRNVPDMSLTVTVITAVYNNAATLQQTLDSIRSQTWPKIEHVVIDGGSTDGSLEILRQRDMPPAVLQSEPDLGIYDALNKGIARADGEVVGFLHADDVFGYPEALADVAGAFADPGVMAVYGDLEYVAKNNIAKVVRKWRSGEFSRGKLGWGWMPPHPTFYVRRGMYEKWGGYDYTYRIAADYDLMLRVLVEGGVKPVYIPRVLVRMRDGGISNSSVRNVLRKSYEDYMVLRHHHVGGLAALCWKNLSKLGQIHL